MNFQKAQRRQAKLRIELSGLPGCGKTRGALLIARGLADSWDKVALIDTENGSGHLYSHLGDYSVLGLSAPYNPERYIEAIQAAEEAGFEVIIIDSTSHEWDGSGGCLELNEKIASVKYKGNSWSAWSDTKPRHQKFIEAITTSKAHIVATVRNKIETVMGDDKKVKKVGMKDIQGEGFEYEVTLSFNMDRETHYALAGKDRTELFNGRDPFELTEKVGKELKMWAESGAAPVIIEKPQPPTTEEIEGIRVRLKALDTTNIGKATAWLGNKKIAKIDNATKAQLDELDAFIKPLEAIQKAKTEENTTND